MVLTMSVADVDSVKTRLKKFLEMLTPSTSTFYTLIENCVKQFWSKHTESHPGMGGWETNVVWIPFGMTPDDARTIIINKVIPWLRQAKEYVGSNSPYNEDFVVLLSYVESHFAKNASVQPAPPVSNPSPPVIERVTTDAVASLQYQVKALQEQITTLRTEVTSFPVMLARVETLEKTVATLQRPPDKPKSWFGSEHPTLLDSRRDPNPYVHLSELLHRIHDLRN